MSDKIKVILVEDSVTFRDLVKNVLEEDSRIEVVSQALNGKVAIPRIRHYEPDILILDQEMPEMSGIELLQEIKGKYPKMGIIMLSSHTTEGARITLKCLEEGAWDFVTKPNLAKDGDPAEYLKKKLIPRILAFYFRKKSDASSVRTEDGVKEFFTPPEPKEFFYKPPDPEVQATISVYPRKKTHFLTPGFCKACAIGISTGGPVALRELFGNLTRRLKAPVFIVQHMPPIFTKQLAESLDHITPITVLEAQAGMPVLPNHAYVAPGGKHMILEKTLDQKIRIQLTDDPPEENCKPSVNKLFRSVANVYGPQAMAVIMTGMGSDGYQGILELYQRNAFILGQSRESCLIYGMPEKPITEGLVDEVAGLKEIAEKIQYLLGVEE